LISLSPRTFSEKCRLKLLITQCRSVPPSSQTSNTSSPCPSLNVPNATAIQYSSTQNCRLYALTLKNRASYRKDRCTATLQMLHFIYFLNKYKY
jgi:hypothetical protein